MAAPTVDPDLADRRIDEDYQGDRPRVLARPHPRPRRRAHRFHRGLSLHGRARRAVSGRFPPGPAGCDRRQPMQWARLQILMPDRSRIGRTGHRRKNRLAGRTLENRRGPRRYGKAMLPVIGCMASTSAAFDGNRSLISDLHLTEPNVAIIAQAVMLAVPIVSGLSLRN